MRGRGGRGAGAGQSEKNCLSSWGFRQGGVHASAAAGPACARSSRAQVERPPADLHSHTHTHRDRQTERERERERDAERNAGGLTLCCDGLMVRMDIDELLRDSLEVLH